MGVTRAALGLSLAGLLAASGCGGRSQTTTTDNGTRPPASGVPQDPSARKVTITPQFCANPGRLNLSKGGKDRYQWHNTSSVDLLIVFKNAAGTEYQPGGELVPAGQFSAVHFICRTCPETLYEYRIHRLEAGNWVEAPCETGGPTVPEVNVGP